MVAVNILSVSWLYICWMTLFPLHHGKLEQSYILLIGGLDLWSYGWTRSQPRWGIVISAVTWQLNLQLDGWISRCEQSKYMSCLSCWMNFSLKSAHDVEARSLQKMMSLTWKLTVMRSSGFGFTHSLFIAVCVISDAVWPHSWLIINQVLQSPNNE